MATPRVNVPDLAFAVFLVALGALAFALAGELRVGSAAAMGPGYVPRGLALIIMVYGRRAGRARGASPGGSRSLSRVAAAAPDRRRGRAVRGSAAARRPRADERRGRDLRRLCRLRRAAARERRAGGRLAAFAVLLFVIALGLPIPIWPRD